MTTPDDTGHVTYEVRDAVALLTMSTPGRSVNVVDEALLSELGDAFTRAGEDDSVRALVLASAKPAFGAGADVDWLPVLAARDDAETTLAGIHDLMLRIVKSSKPMVSAVDRFAFGGALELALAGHGIVATGRTRVGLTEATLGLIPGGGGTQLVQRWVSPETAASLLVSGKQVTATEALGLGLVTSIAEPSDLVATALALALDLAETPRPLRAVPADATERAAAIASAATLRTPSSDARDAIVTALSATEGGLEVGLKAERAEFLRLLAGDQFAALVHVFKAETAARRQDPNANVPSTSRLGVVGGGQMGAGIAAQAARRSLPVTVRDVDPERLDAARARAGKAVGPDADLDATWASTTEWEGFGDADTVVEAVFELPSLKEETLAAIAALVSEDALITTNTSAIQVGSLAPSVPNPSRFLGTHFFSPVEKMPLVELVPHAGTSTESQARARALATQLGKVPVVVDDLPGFFTSRVYARWLIEGLRLLLDGAEPEQIDREARAVGFPVGPIQAHDEATLDLVLKASVTQVADHVMADRIDIDAVRALLVDLIAAGVEGRRLGAGFYAYVDGRRAGANPAVAEVLEGRPGSDVAEGQAGERLLLAFVSECLLCWDDGTLCHPDDGDIAAVLGIGFPRVLGGPFHWTDRTGAADVLQRTEAQGPSFPVADSLRELAASGSRYADAERRATPGIAR